MELATSVSLVNGSVGGTPEGNMGGAKTKKISVAYRLEPDIVESIDLAREALSRKYGMGPLWSKTDVIRYAIKKLLSDLNRYEAYKSIRGAETAKNPDP